MSDDIGEQQFGHAGVEASQGFEPLPEAPAPYEPSQVESGDWDVKTAADVLTGEREAIRGKPPSEREPLHQDYLDEYGEPRPKNQTVSLERAADDLQKFREGIGKQVEDQRDNLVRIAQDNALGKPTGQPNATPQEAQQSQQQAQQWAENLDAKAEVAKVFTPPVADPKVIVEQYLPTFTQGVQYFTNELANIENQITAAAQARQDYSGLQTAAEQIRGQLGHAQYLQRQAQFVQEGMDPDIAYYSIAHPKVSAAIQNMMASKDYAVAQTYQALSQQSQRQAQAYQNLLFGSFPELQQARDFNEVQTIINAIGKGGNVERANAMQRLLQAGVVANRNAEAANARVAQYNHQQLSQYADREAARLHQAYPELREPGVRAQVQTNVVTMLRHLGLGPMMAQQFSTNPLLHNASFQALLYEMYKAITTKSSAKTKLDRSAPAVNRPGTWEAGFSRGQTEERMPESFSGISGYRDAARIITARREARAKRN